MSTAIRIICWLALALGAIQASARDLSKEEIVCGLDPACARPRAPQRGVTVTPGAPEPSTPSVDLYVNFAYDSADLASDARIALDRLGGALRDGRLDGFAFLIAGHTDAKGSADRNQKLSERRADAVWRYLIAQHGLANGRLSSIGYGNAQLLDPSRPEDGVNRRVQVINVTPSGQRRVAAATEADDAAACAKAAGEESIAACSRRIASGALRDRDLAVAYRNRGWALHGKGDDDRAIIDYNEALRIDPKYAHALANRGVAWRHKGDHTRALADLDEALRLQPNYTYAVFQRAFTWAAKGDQDRALADYSEAIRINPKYVDALNNRGNIFRDRHDHDRAMADYNEALRIDPNYSLAYNNRGNAWRAKGDADRAIADFGEAVRINPKYGTAFNNRGMAWADKREHDRAIADYGEAIRIDPGNVNAYNNRGNAWKAKGDNDRAIADYGEAIRLDPKFAFGYGNRGGAWRNKRNLDRAIADLSQAIRLDSGYSAAYSHRGLAYEAKGQVAQARADYNAALASPPKYNSGKWAQDTARSRLAVLAPSGAAPPAQSPPAASGDRIALVIGNGAYQNVPRLPNPPNDARAMAGALRDIGFSVVAANDLDRTRMEAIILEFLRKTLSARIALVFYAGHGVSIDGKNYLVPVDAKSLSRSTVGFELVDVDRILSGLDDEARANVVLLDACRDNPLAARSDRSAARGAGLAAYGTVGSGMLIGFATAPGKTATDGDGTNSPFTAALLKHLKTPKLEINQMLTRVRVDVVEATRREQVPWANSSLLGEVFLNDGTGARSTTR